MKAYLLGILLAITWTLPNISNAATEAKKANKTTAQWVGHAAWIITTPGGAQIAIDPWFDNPKAPKGFKAPAALDAILVDARAFRPFGQHTSLGQGHRRSRGRLL